jgi:hypothetical protein
MKAPRYLAGPFLFSGDLIKRSGRSPNFFRKQVRLVSAAQVWRKHVARRERQPIAAWQIVRRYKFEQALSDR